MRLQSSVGKGVPCAYPVDVRFREPVLSMGTTLPIQD
jgi:hypothetical protein